MAVRKRFLVVTLLPAMLLAGKAVYAQRGTSPTPQPPANMPEPSTKDTASQPSDTGQQQAAVSKQENKAIKAFRDAPATDADKKTQLGEDFIEKYPQSRYRAEVVSWLARTYLVKGQVDKLQAEGDKELSLTPGNPLSLAVLGSNLSRAVNANTPDLQKHLDQAELYCKKSLELVASAQKPAELSEEKFTQAKDETSGVAYSGLGVVAFRKGKYADAIPDMEQAVKLGGGKDPVDYYILGKSNEGASHFDAALAAFTKCAAMPGGMQSACQSSADEVKGRAASAPK
jgi:tetratricopeptide (TPR) repeat protein